MKRPDKLWFKPLDYYVEEDGKGMWFRVPEWLVRGYRLDEMPPNMFRVMFLISDKRVSYAVGNKKFNKELTDEYFKKNWSNKLMLERRKKRKELV